MQLPGAGTIFVPVPVRVKTSPGHKVQGLSPGAQSLEVRVADWLRLGHWAPKMAATWSKKKAKIPEPVLL